MAVGTAALVIILSVYNGFGNLVGEMMGKIEPELLISPAEGKLFDPEDCRSALERVCENEASCRVCSVLEDQVFISYEGRQSVATAKGVDGIYESESPIRDNIRSGSFSLHEGEIPQACVGIGLADRMGINPRFYSPIELFYPSRTRRLSLVSPMSSVLSANVYPSGIFSINSEIDNSMLIVPMETMRKLLDCGDKVSAIELRLSEGSSVRRIQESLQSSLGEDFVVKDRYMQNTSLYRMMKYEKAAVYMILIFVVIIIAFNIFGSLTMLMIEKEDDIRTLESLGADKKLIRRSFTLEGWLVSILGMLAGLAIGVIFVLLQQKLGIIKMPGNFIVQAYPVILSVPDLLAIATGVAVIGYIIALIPAASKIR